MSLFAKVAKIIGDNELISTKSNHRDNSFDSTQNDEEVISSNPIDVNLFTSSTFQMDVVARLEEDSKENSPSQKCEESQEKEDDIEKPFGVENNKTITTTSQEDFSTLNYDSGIDWAKY